MSAEELVLSLQSLYEALGPMPGCLVVDPAVVLTIAGRRFSAAAVGSLTHEAIQSVNACKVNPDLRLRVVDIALDAGKMVLVESLSGLIRLTTESRIPGIAPLHSGWEGESLWRAQTAAALDGDVLSELLRGAPDQAALDTAAWNALERVLPMESAPIAEGQRYRGSDPSFLFFAEHRENPAIVSAVREWSALLTEVYASPWHLRLSQSPEFQAARQEWDS